MKLFGMNNNDGSPIEDEANYLRQSIHDIINTPQGSRVMRRNYGSNVMELIDLPITAYALTQIQAYLASTLLFQQKNIALKKLTVQQQQAKLLITLEGNYIQSGNNHLFDIQITNFKNKQGLDHGKETDNN